MLLSSNKNTSTLACELPISTHHLSHGVHPQTNHAFRNINSLFEPHLVNVDIVSWFFSRVFDHLLVTCHQIYVIIWTQRKTTKCLQHTFWPLQLPNTLEQWETAYHSPWIPDRRKEQVTIPRIWWHMPWQNLECLQNISFIWYRRWLQYFVLGLCNDNLITFLGPWIVPTCISK